MLRINLSKSYLVSYLSTLFLLCTAFQIVASEESLIENLTDLYIAGENEKVVALFDQNPELKQNTFAYRLYINSLIGIDTDAAENASEEAVNLHHSVHKLFLTSASVMGAQASKSVFKALGYAKKAKQKLQTAVALAPNEASAQFGLMSFYLQAPSIAGGDVDEAEAIAAKINQLDAEAGLLASIQVKAAREEDYKADLDAVIEAYPDSVRMLNFAASRYARIEDYERAQSVYSTIMSMPEILLQSEHNNKVDKDENAPYELALSLAQNKTVQLRAYYQFAKLSLDSNKQIAEAIKAIQFYLDESEKTGYAKGNLPSEDWAKLRLSALYLADNQQSRAQEIFNSIQKEDTKRFKSEYKTIAKQLK